SILFIANIINVFPIISPVFNYEQYISKVLNITTGAALFPLNNLFEYCTSKVAMHHGIKCLAIEFPNTSFANFRPGMVDTPLIDKWVSIDNTIFPNGNPYAIAKEQNQLRSLIQISKAIFLVMCKNNKE
ncbi:MAG: hypothetical protein K2P99_01335, partial [Burkholderiales bacterium]|nr:hypothetical protein [Burkholderiales bacterium]